MSLKFDIEWKVRSAIAKVKCGDNEGTAFFIDKARLLTAKHVVMNYFANNEAILVKLGDEEYPCNAIKDETLGSNIDVAILTPINPFPEESINCIHSLPLLASETPVGHTYYIIGYPQEIGNGVDQIKTEVVVLHKTVHIDYDVVVSRIDQLAFYQYDGYSGSPVFNELGKVVGIATDQLSKSLAFTSVFKVKDWFGKENVKYDDDWQNSDMSKFGLGKSQIILKEQIHFIGSRYAPKTHVDIEDFEEKLMDFATLNHKVIVSSINKLVYKLLSLSNRYYSLSQIVVPQVSNQNVLDIIEKYLSEFEPKGKYYADNDKDAIIGALNKLRTDFTNYQRRLDTERKNIFLVEAKAGYGKTHYVCHISEKISKKENVYLFFGSQFNGSGSIESQISTLLKWDNDDFQNLDNEMASQEKFAIIIIDALNEGPSSQWWNDMLNSFCSSLASKNKDKRKYSRIKLIITSRTQTDSYFPISKDFLTERYTLHGFLNIERPVNLYFYKYEIEQYKERALTMYKYDFHTPLFLKLYCEVKSSHAFEDDVEHERRLIYYYYLNYVKNLNISNLVDEDPERNVTTRYMMDVARASLLSYNCSVIPRWKARLYGDQICRWRTWSKSLLNAAEKENLLMPSYYQDKNGEYLSGVMFEYQTLGDFLKAYSFINIRKGINKKLEDIYNIVSDKSKNHRSDIDNFLKALFSDWIGTRGVLKDPKLINNNRINNALRESLEFNGRQSKLVVEWLKSNLSADILLSFIDYFTTNEIKQWHNKMLSMTIHQRDIEWSTSVNILMDSEKADRFRMIVEKFIDSTNCRIQDSFVILCWLCTSSNPQQRNIVQRKLTFLFEQHFDLIVATIEIFKTCNDPYVLEILYESIYGVVLRLQDKNIVNAIAHKVYEVNYSDNHSIPMDVVVRQWTMLILHRAKALDKTLDFHLAVPPFATQSIPELPTLDVNENMFGDDIHSHQIYSSLYYMGDFSRYVIGTNYEGNSNFFIKENKEYKPYPTDSILNMISYFILNQCQWGNDISSLDNGNVYGTRFENFSERIGKKYQWLGLRWAYAILSDNCRISNVYSYESIDEKHLVDIPYPWYISTYSHHDPTLTEEDCKNLDFHIIVENQPIDDMSLSLKQWDDEKLLPEQRLIFKDEKAEEWIILIDYDSRTLTQRDGIKRERFLYNNSFFYNLKEEEVIKQWGSQKPFYPRNDMPEHTGSINFLWNEIPWADAYKHERKEEAEEKEGDDGTYFNQKPKAVLTLTYVAQLQEEAKGLIAPSELKWTTVYAPNEDVINKLGLYTAERGIIRRLADNEVIAINFNAESIHGLAIKKEMLDKYLSDNKLGVVYCTIGEKYSVKDMTAMPPRLNLSGCWIYSNGVLNNIQELRHIPQEEWNK